MSVEWFDLALRLHANQIRRPVNRLGYTLFRPSLAALAVHARSHGDTVALTVASAIGRETSARGRDALALLAANGATVTATAPPMLLVEDHDTVPLLDSLGRAFAHDNDPAIRHAAALCGWWSERNDFPGTSALVNLLTASRTRYVLGTAPEAEQRASIWRQWFGLPVSGTVGMLDWAAKTGGPHLLPLLDDVHLDDAKSLEYLRKAVLNGYDWTRSDSPRRAALGLKARNDYADVWAAALLTDPLWRQRSIFSGHVATATVSGSGQLHGRARTAVLDCDRIDSRLRAGTAITGWSGALDTMPPERDRFFGEVRLARMDHGRRVLELGGFRNGRVPTTGARVVVLPDAPSPQMLARGRSRYSKLYGRDPWVTRSVTPQPRRRDVPLDVIVAGADDD